ncbi:GlxA family transcriptional regulator [Lentibacter algarum]|uniref:GlxA family transcriptional regulator n=1 Tax=Lentibacter algarum TaxID=576131 RepID=UPI001C08D906|nr:GlxA family transcriptional regulator [Lentibacter algarum]MBU2983689.1 GlxA family transcriptional regulator [Lentibacter algarum]
MQNWKIESPPKQVFDILLFDQFSNHCLANTVEPMRAVNAITRETRYSWRFLSLDGTTVESSSGMQITPHGSLNNEIGNMLFIMPSYGFRDFGNWNTSRHLRSAAHRYDRLAGLDTGSWLMAQAGLLDGHRATIHWDEFINFAETFPNVDARRERFIIDQNRITCSGATAAFDLIMHLIGQAHGQRLTMEVAQLFMTQDNARTYAPSNRKKSKLVDKAISVMQENLEKPLTIGDVARRVGVSQKTLENRMRVELNATPQIVYRTLRLNLARKLVLDTDQSVLEIANRCGYDNASAMTRAFKAEFNQTPRAMRGL